MQNLDSTKTLIQVVLHLIADNNILRITMTKQLLLEAQSLKQLLPWDPAIQQCHDNT